MSRVKKPYLPSPCSPLPIPLDSPGWRRAGHSSLLFEITELTSVNVFGEDRWRCSNVIGTGIFIPSRFLFDHLRFSLDPWLALSFFLEEFFDYFSMVQYCLLFLFPFFCTAPFILNVKIKIVIIVILPQIWRYRYVYVYYTCQIFFIFFVQILCKYLLISFFFFTGIFISLFPIVMNLN